MPSAPSSSGSWTPSRPSTNALTAVSASPVSNGAPIANGPADVSDPAGPAPPATTPSFPVPLPARRRLHPLRRGRPGAAPRSTPLLHLRVGRGARSVRCITSPGNTTSLAFHIGLRFVVDPATLLDGVPVQRDYDGRGLDRVSLTGHSRPIGIVTGALTTDMRKPNRQRRRCERTATTRTITARGPLRHKIRTSAGRSFRRPVADGVPRRWTVPVRRPGRGRHTGVDAVRFVNLGLLSHDDADADDEPGPARRPD